MLLALIILLHRLGHPGLELLDPSAVGWMIGKQFRRLRRAHLFHSASEVDTLPRIVSRTGHVNESDVVCFRFVIATEWHKHAILGAGAKRTEDRPLLFVIHVRKGARQSDHRGLSQILLENPLCTMA